MILIVIIEKYLSDLLIFSLGGSNLKPRPWTLAYLEILPVEDFRHTLVLNSPLQFPNILSKSPYIWSKIPEQKNGRNAVARSILLESKKSRK